MKMSVQSLLIFLSASSVLIHSTHTTTLRRRPTFTSEPQSLIVKKQAAVVLNCTIENLGDYTVIWRYLDHDVTISVNETIIASNKDHYVIRRPVPEDENTTYPLTNWYLEIKSVDRPDIGYYSCEVKNVPGVLQVSVITIEGVPAPAKPRIIQKTNNTACCKAYNVTKTCLPICSPHTFSSVTFHYEDCYKNLSAILTCGSDGRNHIPCCRQRRIPDHCLKLCMNDMNFTSYTTSMTKECYDRMKDITECFAEGQVALPGPPVKIHSSVISKMSAFVGWEPPKYNKKLVTGYKLFYAKAASEHFTASHLIEKEYYILKGLEENMYYKMYVQAISKHGSSRPSYETKVFIRNDTVVVDGGKKVTDCCQKKLVSKVCLPILCGGPSRNIDSDKVMDCIGDFKTALDCYSGHRDHTPCCLSKGVHSSCLDFCKGKTTPALDIKHLMCVSYMNDVSNCLMEGLAILPGHPTDLTVSSVTTEKAVVSWKPPTENKERVMNYIVKYKPKHSDLIPPKEIRVDSKTYNATLDNLTKGTLYEVYVVAGNSAGTSAPSPAAVFLTYSAKPESGIVLPPFHKAPYNVTECCVLKKLHKKCLPICSFTTNPTAMKSVPSFCTTDLQLLKTIFTCGTDNRDHTPCCKREKLATKCLETCKVTTSTQLDTSHKECLINITSIFKCYEEGSVLLPHPPRKITIKAVSANHMTVAWEKPDKAPEGVLYYLVEYKKSGDPTWKSENTTQKEFRLQNLKPNSWYSVRVRAANNFGMSLHGNEIAQARTKAEGSGGTAPTTVPPPTKPLTSLTRDIAKCCKDSKVSDPCLKLCTGAQPGHMLQCKKDFNKVVSCAADKRDHTPCCQRRAVPSFCLKYCKGQSADQLTALACHTHLEQIRGCFFEGYNTLPSPPVEYTITAVKVDEIGSAWKPPVIHHNNTMFNLHYDLAGQNLNKMAEDVKSPYTLGNLTADTLYDLYTVSVNKYGSSLPSTSFSVYTYEHSKDALKITVSYSPKGYIREGQDVTFKCLVTATSTGTPEIQWWREEKEIAGGAEYKVKGAKIKDQGKYTCKVKNNNELKVKTIFLRMQYRPKVTVPEPWVDVPPRKYQEGHMKCIFDGYPEKLVWYFNGYEMHKYTYTKVTTIRNDTTGKTEFSLMIRDVIHSDYGLYSCLGRTPGVGQATGYIHLFDNTSSTSQPKIKPAAKVLNVSVCCAEKSVATKCRVACQFDVDLSAMKDVLVDCVKDLKNIVLCAADGKDHSTCCNSNKVPLMCQPLCAGVLPKLPMDKLLYCLGYSTAIVDCMEVGSVTVPSRPRSLRGSSGSSWVLVAWDPPAHNAEFVQKYVVHYRLNGGKEKTVTVFKWRTEVRLSSLRAGKEYDIYVVAMNHHGKSQPSQTLFISTKGAPYPPQELICLPTNSNIRLSWNSPVSTVPFSKFRVYYRADNINGGFKSMDTTSFNLLLDGLIAGEEYTMFVRSVSEDGLLSKESNRCHLYAPGKAPTKPPKSGTNIGLGIGLGVVLIVLVIAATIIIYFMWKKRAATANKKPTVSFENPAYKPRGDNPDANGGEVQISGLPGQEEQPIQTFGPPSNSVPGPRSTSGAVIGNPYAETNMSSPPAEKDLGVSPGQLDVNRLDASQVKVEINYDTGVSES